MTKRIVLAVVLATIGASGLFALNWQAYPVPLKPGNIMVNLGVGFGTPLHGNMVIPPISASFDYALGGLPFTLGALAGFMTSEYTYDYTGGYGYTYDYTGLAIAGRFGYHPDLGVKNLDVSANLALGYYLYTAKANYNGSWSGPKPDPKDYSRLYLGFNLGGRYFFTDNVGAFLELGYSALSFVTAGVTFRI
ncbi:MAG: hypothetical protein LBK63_04200 [Treponema sp.]|nr:hypothetical protein [Treponema sp.]